MPRPLMLVAALVGCAGSKSPADPVDTAADAAEETALPEIWGPVPLEDQDPAAGVVEVHLRAGVSDAQWVDGDKTEVWAYNDVVPGPVVQARVGDTVRVVFENDLPEETTIHWHGLRISDDMDGVPAIQDPVQPGETFTYEFVVPDAGSFWYHPHVRAHEQVERGLYGTLVVHEAEPVDIPERYFVLDDVWLDGSDIADFTMSHPEQMHGRHGNVLLVNGSTEPLQDTVAPASPERWRVVNTANARTMWVGVTGADWRIVAIDGTLLPEPVEVERAVLPVGQRLDLEVVPHADAEAAALQIELPSGSSWSAYPMFEASIEGEPGDGGFVDWDAPALPEVHDATQEVALNLNVRGGGSDIKWIINGDQYGEHDDITVDGHTPSVIEIVDRSGAEHPFHLHGQFFQVLDRDGEQIDEDGGLRDTILVGPRETLRLYTEFDNPGRWMSHCHILEHAELGMMTEMVVGD
jgi:FtsP/CotA-like multicopper oxidase with cupredoxin domain